MSGELTKRSEPMINLIEKIIGAVAAAALLMAFAVSPGFAQEEPGGSSADEDDAPILIPPSDEDDTIPTIPDPPNSMTGCFLCQFLGRPPDGMGVNLSSVKHFIRRYEEEGENLFNINGVDRNRRTALHLAARYKTSDHAEIATLLVQQPDVNVNILDHRDRTPMRFAAGFRNTAVVSLLLESERIILDSHSTTRPIELAIERGTPQDYGIARIFANSDLVPIAAFPHPARVIRYALKNNLDDLAKTVNEENGTHAMYGGKPLIFYAVSHENQNLVSAILTDSANQECTRKFEWANPVVYVQDLDNPEKYEGVIRVLEENGCERDIDPEYCYNKEEGTTIKYIEQNEDCIPCGPSMEREGNECKETLESCNAINKILKHKMCEPCPPNSERNGNECIPEICGNVESQRQLYRAHSDAVCDCTPDSERHVPEGQKICECMEQNHEWLNEQYNCVEKPLAWGAWNAMDMDLFNFLIDNTLNISVNFEETQNGRNLLYAAIYRTTDSSDWVPALIRVGVRPDIPAGTHGFTAIHRLSGGTGELNRDYTFPLLNAILSAPGYTNINIDAVETRNGVTALHWAAHKNWTEHAKLLIDEGANCDLSWQGSGWTARDSARLHNNTPLIQYMDTHCAAGAGGASAGGASGQSEETAPLEAPRELIIPPEPY